MADNQARINGLLGRMRWLMQGIQEGAFSAGYTYDETLRNTFEKGARLEREKPPRWFQDVALTVAGGTYAADIALPTAFFGGAYDYLAHGISNRRNMEIAAILRARAQSGDMTAVQEMQSLLAETYRQRGYMGFNPEKNPAAVYAMLGIDPQKMAQQQPPAYDYVPRDGRDYSGFYQVPVQQQQAIVHQPARVMPRSVGMTDYRHVTNARSQNLAYNKNADQFRQAQIAQQVSQSAARPMRPIMQQPQQQPAYQVAPMPRPVVRYAPPANMSVYHGRVPERLKKGPIWEKEHNRWVMQRRRARQNRLKYTGG